MDHTELLEDNEIGKINQSKDETREDTFEGGYVSSDDYNTSNSDSAGDVLALDGTDDATDLDDSVKMYLRQIGSVKLLTADEEIELAKQIKLGDENPELSRLAKERLVSLRSTRGKGCCF